MAIIAQGLSGWQEVNARVKFKEIRASALLHKLLKIVIGQLGWTIQYPHA